MARKYGPTRLIRKATTKPRKTRATRKTTDSSALIINAMNMALISVIGALVNIRIIIWNAICTFVTSVVRRVTRPAVEKWSILEKENS